MQAERMRLIGVLMAYAESDKTIRDDSQSLYSISSSARPDIGSGTVMPSVFAVFPPPARIDIAKRALGGARHCEAGTRGS
jgi:hypothetical protein